MFPVQQGGQRGQREKVEEDWGHGFNSRHQRPRRVLSRGVTGSNAGSKGPLWQLLGKGLGAPGMEAGSPGGRLPPRPVQGGSGGGRRQTLGILKVELTASPDGWDVSVREGQGQRSWEERPFGERGGPRRTHSQLSFRPSHWRRSARPRDPGSKGGHCSLAFEDPPV